MRRAFANLALLFGATVLALGLVEVALRIHPLHQRVRHGVIVLPANRVETMRNDRVAGVPARVVKRRNSLGFRGAEPAQPFGRYLTIVTVGGSTTEATYQPDGSTWTDRVGVRLADCFDDVWINNAGLDGHTSFGHLALLQDYLVGLAPKVAVFLVGANDRWAREPSSWDRESGVGGITSGSATALGKALAARSETADLLVTLYRAFRAWRHGAWYTAIDWAALPEGDPYPPDGAATLDVHRATLIPAYEERLTMLATLARGAGILPVFVTQPIVFGPVKDPTTGKDLSRLRNGVFALDLMELYNAALRTVAAREGVALIDLAAQMPKDTALFFDTVHYTTRGEETVAAIIEGGLRPILMAHFPAYQRPTCAAGTF